MKIKFVFLMFFLSVMFFNLYAQKTASVEKYGNTLNLGLGIGGYSGYYGGHSMPVLAANYEFDAANYFTLAPFITFYSYGSDHYRETIIPLGVKGSYYFDKLLHADSKWDFYLAGSLGFAIVNTSWDNNYHGDRNYYHTPDPLFLDIHAGAEYHFNQRLGIFLDLSTGISTIGLAIH
ncbi:MAG: hypothetical protein NTW49_06105 [Bacteroidia bacterium]|nr:hypothetical protein [Bacteroidia bacterium]